MYFITNYAITQTKRWSPTRNTPERSITLHPRDREPGASVFFCRRDGDGDYKEIGSKAFFQLMKGPADEEILLYIHGFNNTPEGDVFPRAEALQRLCDSGLGGHNKSITVISLMWPCDDDLGIIKDYWDDQDSSDQSAFGFARVLGKFMDWRQRNTGDDACYRPINILAHSMGNRVLRLTLSRWVTYQGRLPALFRNVFMVAADIVNESLERGKSGYPITQSSRNVVVYYANDDLAMTASKVANVRNKVASRRLGHTGPEDMDQVSANVFAIDCDEVNNVYDSPKGHSYFLGAAGTAGAPGAVFDHILQTLITGRPRVVGESRRLVIGDGTA